jgi:diguanylate cyclase (GGDEF)-like protein
MGTSTVALAVAFAAVLAFALVAWVSVRARNRAEEGTRAVLLRISDGMESVSAGLASVVDQATTPSSEVAFPVTLDLTEGLRRVAAVAATLPGMTAGAARIDLVDGSVAVNAVGIVSGSTGLETAPDPPDRHAWRSATIEWSQEASVTGTASVQRGVIVPVWHNRERIGLVGAYTTGPLIAPDVLEAVVALADSAAPGLAAAREHEALKELVRTDPLTGMLNRRGLDEDLTREVARATRTGAPLSVLMLDLDDFSRANKSTHAHGDDVLREFGRVIREACRETDIPCRRGGEEFTVILPDTECSAALRVDARIRALVSATEFPHLGRLTYSSGVTMLREGDDAVTVDERASELVNLVKRRGKDNVAHDCGEA